MSSDAIRENLNECTKNYDYWGEIIFSPVACAWKESSFRMVHERRFDWIIICMSEMWKKYGIERKNGTYYRHFKQPELHLRGVGASCPSLPSGLRHSHISTG
ncbi:hypothetical protein TNCV_4108761 [Trichonephila clavipes]|nr:hypothetical protein TNCV_4108761 [Trichonephila clavipes]